MNPNSHEIFKIKPLNVRELGHLLSYKTESVQSENDPLP